MNFYKASIQIWTIEPGYTIPGFFSPWLLNEQTGTQLWKDEFKSGKSCGETPEKQSPMIHGHHEQLLPTSLVHR